MPTIDVVIPCYRVRDQIRGVLDDVLQHELVRNVIVVDDACPEQTGALVEEHYGSNPRVAVLTHDANQGVGGAMCTGYAHAFADAADIVVKLDGDGQMDPRHIAPLVKPIVDGKCDYAKGNRFFHPRHLRAMPSIRMLGNSVLSFVNKFSSGYWSVMDPTNGFTALHRNAYRLLQPTRLARDFFFESDMLYQLGKVHAVVRDVPLPAIYGAEKSNLKVSRVLLGFPGRYLVRLIKRIVLRYFIRDFTFASLEVLFGLLLFSSGLAFGIFKWVTNAMAGAETPAGTVMIVGILIIVGFQLLLSALNYDVSHEPSVPLSYLDLEE